MRRLDGQNQIAGVLFGDEAAGDLTVKPERDAQCGEEKNDRWDRMTDSDAQRFGVRARETADSAIEELEDASPALAFVT